MAKNLCEKGPAPLKPNQFYGVAVLAGESQPRLRIGSQSTLALALIFLLEIVQFAGAQLPTVSDARLGVDVVRMNDGKRLYGFVLQQQTDWIRLAVEHKWLAATYPEYAAGCLQEQLAESKQANKQLIARIEQWINERTDDAVLRQFLEAERERIVAREQDVQSLATGSRFLVLDIARADVREVKLQPAERRQIAGLAYVHDLERVVATPATLLHKSLSQLGVDPQTETVDLSSDLPQDLSQSDKEWAARKALVEFQLREPLEYQGTEGLLLRKADHLDMANLLAQLMGSGGLDTISQLGAELGLPEFKKKARRSEWWSTAVSEAERDGFRGVLITRLEQQLLSSTVSVHTTFFAMLEPGQWFPVVHFSAKSNAAEQSQERVDRLQDDPQVKQVMETLKTLGINADDRIDQALRHGAATDQALQRAQGLFYTFLGQQIRALDAPPVVLPDR